MPVWCPWRSDLNEATLRDHANATAVMESEMRQGGCLCASDGMSVWCAYGVDAMAWGEQVQFALNQFIEISTKQQTLKMHGWWRYYWYVDKYMPLTARVACKMIVGV